MSLQRAESLITTVPSTVAVTAAVGSAGQAIPPSATSARVRLANPRVGGPVEYKVGAASWVLLDKSQGVQLDIDLATVAVLLRKASAVAGVVTIAVEVDALNRVGLGAASVDGGGSSGSVSSAPATNIVIDSQGRPLTYTVAGVNKTVSYGQYGVSTITGSDGNVETYSYDAAGNLTGIVNSNGSTSAPSAISFDTDGTTLTFAASGVTYTVAYLTNAKGKQVSTVTGGGHVTTYSYDGTGNFTGSTTV